MFFVAVMAAGLWGLGAAFGAPQRSRWIMILALLATVIAAHLVLPVGHPVRLALGETAAPWLFVLGIAGLVWGYRWMLRRLRTQAVVKEEAAAIDAPLFSETELNRYARHIVMREMGGAQVKRRSNKRRFWSWARAVWDRPCCSIWRQQALEQSV